MRPVVRTFFIIWAVLASILALIFIIIASSMSANQQEVIQTLVDRGMAYQTAQESVAMTLTVLFTFGFVALAAGIYSAIMASIVVREGLKFPVRLTLSIAAIVLLILLPGILMLVDTIHTRNGVIEEPESEEPKESV